MLHGGSTEAASSEVEQMTVDHTVKGANWRPSNTDLHTACGGHESLGVREVLDTDSADTYGQYLAEPRQSAARPPTLLGLLGGRSAA